jgi:hypothetical protein
MLRTTFALMMLSTAACSTVSPLQNYQRHMAVGYTGCPSDSISISNEQTVQGTPIRLFDISCRGHQFHCSSFELQTTQGMSCHEAL